MYIYIYTIFTIYTIYTIYAGEGRVLFTKWVRKAWQETYPQIKYMVIRSFVKCGIALRRKGQQNKHRGHS